jgi:PIN domain nuclease of toxin-antitoxin system
VNVLIDTHTFLYFLLDHRRLSATASSLLDNDQNFVFLSVASLWELAIKVRIGRLQLGRPFGDFMQRYVYSGGFQLLPIDPSHVEMIARLPMHHRDPSDRMLVAQALVESLPIVSVDPALDLYGVVRIW